MKEFLVKDDDGIYFKVDDASKYNQECVIEIPDGAEELYKFKGGALEFYKDDCSKFFSISNNGWYPPVRSCLETRDIAEMIWKREKESIIDKLQDLPEVKHDVVNHPNHYTNGNIECIDAIQASMSIEAFAGFLKGNIIKYMWRYEHKNGIEDLKKAQWYQKKLIELLG